MSIKYLFQYSRVSSKSQVSGGGLSQQALKPEQLEDLCKQYDVIPYPEVFSDAGVSAFTVSSKDRPNLSRIIELLESPNVSNQSVLCLSNLDRLSREDLTTALHTLTGLMGKCRIYITQEHKLFDVAKDASSQTMDLMMALLSLSRAHDESLVKSKRKHENIYARIDAFKNGKRGKTGRSLVIPTGKKPLWCKPTHIDFEVHNDQYRVDAVREVVKLLTQGLSISEVYDQANKRYPDLKFREQFIRRLHTNRALIGELSVKVQDVEHVLVGYFEPVLTESEFYRLVSARKQTNRLVKSGNVSVFSGYKKSYCRGCGEPLVTVTERGNSVLRCRGSREGTKCTNPVTVRYRYLLEALKEINLELRALVQEHEPSNDSVGKLEDDLLVAQGKYESARRFFNDDPNEDTHQGMKHWRKVVDDIKNELERNKLESVNSDLSVLGTMPTDLEELREYLKKALASLRLHRVSRGVTLVSLYLVNGFSTNFVIEKGKLGKVGLLSGDNRKENSLRDDLEFMKYVENGSLDRWFTDPKDYIEQ